MVYGQMLMSVVMYSVGTVEVELDVSAFYFPVV